jgi:hypothetical protein
VVVERDARAVQGAHGPITVGIQPGQQPARGRAAGADTYRDEALRALGGADQGRRRWVGRPPVGEQPLIPGPQAGPRVVVDPLGPDGAGPVGDQLDVGQYYLPLKKSGWK